MKRILKKIAKELSKIEDVKAVILYGSLAREEFTSRSDVDLFILTTEDKIQKEIHDKVIELESEIGRNIQPTIRTIAELQKTDTGLLQNIFQEGKILLERAIRHTVCYITATKTLSDLLFSDKQLTSKR